MLKLTDLTMDPSPVCLPLQFSLVRTEKPRTALLTDGPTNSSAAISKELTSTKTVFMGEAKVYLFFIFY